MAFSSFVVLGFMAGEIVLFFIEKFIVFAGGWRDGKQGLLLLLVAITLYDRAEKSFVGGSLTLASKLLLVAITLYDLVAIPEEEVYVVEGVDDEEPLTPL
ncbi:hypothetical protein ACOSP7_024003 [Xanthoceras sorbifolium]